MGTRRTRASRPQERYIEMNMAAAGTHFWDAQQRQKIGSKATKRAG